MARINARLFVATLAFTLAGSALAGPLTPPAGPVSSTHKTLTQVEPRTPVQTLSGDSSATYIINQSGSYYLTGNIVGESGKSGILITTSNVTIDLNGFSIIGVSGSLDGVRVVLPAFPLFPATNIAVRNGSISFWGEDGIDGSVAAGMRVEDVQVSFCSGTGVVLGTAGSVERVTVYNGITSNGHGIKVGTGGVVANCVAERNAGHGVLAGDRALVRDSVARFNNLDGIRSEGSGSFASMTVRNCTVSDNGANGITASWSSQIVDNHCRDNKVVFLLLGSDNRIENNTVIDNARGIDTNQGGNFIVRNTAANNTTLNYDLAGTNTVGPIITATGTIATNSPWANFSY